MRCLALILLWLMYPGAALAQSSTVLPTELELSVTVEEKAHTPFTREMVLISIRGVYRRHITLEKLVQPDFEGFNWAQLGPDAWHEERLDGRLVKVFTRRMAVYPDRPGRLTIDPFQHELTLTDENDDWFEHRIVSNPVSIEVAPVPVESDWWFPVRSLRISDRWSNAPDQLQPGEGVLRIVQLEALGATPEMIPPMPELTSPSAMIFPHPEKRLVELTPDGPVTYAFWRWTIRPTNDTSTIVEPLSFDFFNTRTREAHEVTISAQRVAYGAVTPDAARENTGNQMPAAQLPGWPLAVLALVIFAIGLAMTTWGRRLDPHHLPRHLPWLDPLARRLRRAVRKRDGKEVRRAARAMLQRDGDEPTRQDLLENLDRKLFDPRKPSLDLRKFANAFLTRTPVIEGAKTTTK